MADYRLGILQTDIGIVFGCMRPLVKDHPCVAAVLARISLRPDCCKISISLKTPESRVRVLLLVTAKGRLLQGLHSVQF